jgi:hypothetical protein
VYYDVVTQMIQSLKHVNAWLDEAEAYADSRKFDVQVLLDSRLAPDMKPFIYQIQSACDYLKGAAGWLSGQRPPAHADTEHTMDEVRVRIAKTIAFAESVAQAEYEGAAERLVEFSWAPGLRINGRDYLLQMVVPNVYFHLTTAYALLRHNGVPLGKMDYIGTLNLQKLTAEPNASDDRLAPVGLHP